MLAHRGTLPAASVAEHPIVSADRYGKLGQRRQQLSKYVMHLIVAQKLSDAQIVAACTKKYPDRKMTPNIAALYRKAINSGSKAGSGFPAVEIGGKVPAAAANARPRARATAEQKGAAPTPAQPPVPTARRRV